MARRRTRRRRSDSLLMSISALSAVANLIKYRCLFMLLLGFCNLLVMLSVLCCCELCFLNSNSLLNNLPVSAGLLRHITVCWQVSLVAAQSGRPGFVHVQGRLQCKMPTLCGQWCRWLLSRTGSATHDCKSSIVHQLHCVAYCASDASSVVPLMHISVAPHDDCPYCSAIQETSCMLYLLF